MLVQTGKLKKHRGKTATNTTSESNGNYKPLGKTTSTYSGSNTILKDKKSVSEAAEKLPKILNNRDKKVLVVEDNNIPQDNPITSDTQLVRVISK